MAYRVYRHGDQNFTSQIRWGIGIAYVFDVVFIIFLTRYSDHPVLCIYIYYNYYIHIVVRHQTRLQPWK